MTFNYNSRLSLPTAITRTTSNASFYGSLSIHERFERLASGQELDLLGISVSRSSVLLQMSTYPLTGQRNNAIKAIFTA
jgi:hypothetical protein